MMFQSIGVEKLFIAFVAFIGHYLERGIRHNVKQKRMKRMQSFCWYRFAGVVFLQVSLFCRCRFCGVALLQLRVVLRCGYGLYSHAFILGYMKNIKNFYLLSPRPLQATHGS